MIRLSLAIPVLGCAFLASSISFHAQEYPTPAVSTVSSASATAPSPRPNNLSDEEQARLFLVRKQFREAQDLFHKLTLEYPKNAVYWNELGIAFHNQIELAAALKCYERAAKLDSHYADAVNNMGTIYYERRKYPKAIRAYKRAINIRNDFSPFYMNLGYAYFGKKEYDDSIASFRKALELDPDAFDIGKSRSGTIIQDRSIRTDRGLFYFLLAKSFASAGNIERCVIYLRKARDDGYTDINSAKSDPSFAKVISDPAVQEALAPKPIEPTEATQP
jgi:tetratricopeptide (TPR) repeat protein